MSDKEIAMTITLKAIECKFIQKVNYGTAEKINRENTEAASEIANFYRTILSAVEKDNWVVQE